MLLEKINEPNDIKKLDTADYDVLAEEIRDFLIKKILLLYSSFMLRNAISLSDSL